MIATIIGALLGLVFAGFMVSHELAVRCSDRRRR